MLFICRVWISISWSQLTIMTSINWITGRWYKDLQNKALCLPVDEKYICSYSENYLYSINFKTLSGSCSGSNSSRVVVVNWQWCNLLNSHYHLIFGFPTNPSCYRKRCCQDFAGFWFANFRIAKYRPDTVVFMKQCHCIIFVEISCLTDVNVFERENEKILKYQPLAIEASTCYIQQVEVTPIIFGYTGSFAQSYLKKLPCYSFSSSNSPGSQKCAYACFKITSTSTSTIATSTTAVTTMPPINKVGLEQLARIYHSRS